MLPPPPRRWLPSLLMEGVRQHLVASIRVFLMTNKTDRLQVHTSRLCVLLGEMSIWVLCTFKKLGYVSFCWRHWEVTGEDVGSTHRPRPGLSEHLLSALCAPSAAGR